MSQITVSRNASLARGGADDERRCEADGSRRQPRILHAGEERAVRGGADLGARLVHGRQSGRDKPGEVHIIEARDPYILRQPIAIQLARLLANACENFVSFHDLQYKGSKNEECVESKGILFSFFDFSFGTKNKDRSLRSYSASVRRLELPASWSHTSPQVI